MFVFLPFVSQNIKRNEYSIFPPLTWCKWHFFITGSGIVFWFPERITYFLKLFKTFSFCGEHGIQLFLMILRTKKPNTGFNEEQKIIYSPRTKNILNFGLVLKPKFCMGQMHKVIRLNLECFDFLHQNIDRVNTIQYRNMFFLSVDVCYRT